MVVGMIPALSSRMLTRTFLSFTIALGLFACGDSGSDEASGELCGGFRGAPCAGDNEFCDYPETSSCGANDQSGTCQARPTSCDTSVAPVMGSDGEVYNNACLAHAAGVDDCGPAASI
jgi:hypothetical protein